MERQPNYRFATEKPDHIMVSFSGDSRTSMTVTWRAAESVSEGYIEFYEKNGERRIANAIVKPFKSDVNTSNIFWASAENLTPGTRYYYTCGSKENRSDEFYFETQPENLTKFKFIAISDHQKDDDHYDPNYMPFNKFMKKVLEENPDTRFILTAGDNTNCGQHEIQWNAMFEGMQGIMEHIPYMMSCGNHDNRGFRQYFPNEVDRYYAEPAEFFNAQLEYSYPKNGPEGWQTENYSFDYGNVHFVVFGINEPVLVNDWAEKNIDASDKTWKLGTYHFPIYYAGPNLANDDAYPMMRGSMEKLDVLFSGHEHNFSRTYPIRNEEIFDRPSQGTVHYELGNGNANPPGTRMVDKVWHCSFYPQDEYVSAYTIVEVDGEKIKFTSKLDDGRIFDECVIDKANDEILPHRVAPVFRNTRTMFKGYDLGLCVSTTQPEYVDGKWFVPFGTLVNFIGGDVLREKDKISISVYGKSATFYLDSDIAQTNNGEFKLEAPVYKGIGGQLYIPLDSACKIFKMKWAYAKRNNFISIECESEDHPIPTQP